MLKQYTSIDQIDKELARDMGELAEDPLEWVKYSFGWGEGDLEGFSGPDVWQEGFLREWGEEIRIRGFDGRNPVMPVMTTTTSGHGVGKSALVGWIVWFILSTRPHCRGRVTANSMPQLETTTWPEIIKWGKHCVTERWFRSTSGRGAMKIAHKKHPETWRVNGIAWDEHRPAAFAGVHAATSSAFYVFDEASEIAKIILETAQGGLTDGEPFMFLFGNPTKPTGYFYESHAGQMAKRFLKFRVDSRTAKMTNKELIRAWIEDYGIDSDYVKVRVLGDFPLQGNRQLIPTSLVTAAMDQEREPIFTAHDPFTMGVDVARYGDDESTIYIRAGRDGRTFEPLIFRGLDNVQLAHEIRKANEKLLCDAINIDAGGGSGVIDLLRAWGVPNVHEVWFGGTSPDHEYADMASWMMGQARDWLKLTNVTLPDDPVLKRQLTSREYSMVEGKKGTSLKIEPKELLKKHAEKESPDRSDGFCLTFATPVKMRDLAKTKAMLEGKSHASVVNIDYDRFAELDRRDY